MTAEPQPFKTPTSAPTDAGAEAGPDAGAGADADAEPGADDRPRDERAADPRPPAAVPTQEAAAPDAPTQAAPTQEDIAEAQTTIRLRPASLDPQELGFVPRTPVRWLAPWLLITTGLRTLLALLFGAYLDKRELQNALPSDILHQPGTDGELWLDYVADLGDGFDATYSIAYLLAQPHLDIDGERLPRGRVLVMGGDQVYPTANIEAYEDRCKGPYNAALPCPPLQGQRPTLYAVPGNHDWYDGLTAFLRLFVRVKTDNIGGWRIEQSRSYFAVELPANWWLLAIDEQSGAYIDDPQLLYFEKVASKLGPENRVILVTPAPTWVKAVDNPRAYNTLDYFIRTIIAPTGAQLRLVLAGDLHHYARYEGTDRQLITCGGGGAYLYATHKLPEDICVPPLDTLSRKASPSREYALAGRYPEKARSRRYAWGVFHRLPWRNPSFVAFLGLVQTLLMLAWAGVAAERASGVEQRLLSIPLAIMLLVTMGTAILFASPPGAGGKRHVRSGILGVMHGLAQVGLGWLGTLLWLELPFFEWPWPLPVVAAAVLYGPVIGLAASQVVSAYLLVAGFFGVNLNELFAGQGIEDSKIFLRMHIADNGTLTIHPLAVDRVSRRWRPNPAGERDAPWLEPEDELQPRRAEPPIKISR